MENATEEVAKDICMQIAAAKPEFVKREDVPADESAFVTTEMPYGDITEKIESLKNEGVEVLSTIRIGDL